MKRKLNFHGCRFVENGRRTEQRRSSCNENEVRSEQASEVVALECWAKKQIERERERKLPSAITELGVDLRFVTFLSHPINKLSFSSSFV